MENWQKELFMKMAAAHVLINCETGKEESIIVELKKFDGVREVEPVFGVFDIVVKLESPNPHEIRDNALMDIRKIKDVISTITLLHLNE